MISPNVEQYLQDHLRGVRSAEETREILALIDQAGTDEGALVAEFDELLAKVAKKIPGLAIDLNRLLSGDPIESDPLVSQGNLALLRLDAVYHQTYAAWTKSGADLHRVKRTNSPPDARTYSESKSKEERTEQNYPPDAQLLSQIVNITLSAFRIQATLTHRRDLLSPVSRDATRSALPPSQFNSSDIIDHTESLTDQLDDCFLAEIKPMEGDIALIRGLSKLSPLKGYNPLSQIIHAPAPGTADVPVGSINPTSNKQSVNEPTAKSPHPKQRAPSEEKPITANKLYKVSIANPLSAYSAPPREPIPLATNEPNFHQRE